MHPASGYLFFQGTLDSEFDGRVKRLRQEVRDLGLEDLADDDASVVRRLTGKYGLGEITVGEAELVEADEDEQPARLRVAFTGSGVLLHRSPGGEPPAGELLPGWVVETMSRVDGERIRYSRVELPVPDNSSADDPRHGEWRASALASLSRQVTHANGRLPRFHEDLRKAAEEAVRTRRAKLAKAAGDAVRTFSDQ
jgi:hypothetical protein